MSDDMEKAWIEFCAVRKERFHQGNHHVLPPDFEDFRTGWDAAFTAQQKRIDELTEVIKDGISVVSEFPESDELGDSLWAWRYQAEFAVDKSQPHEFDEDVNNKDCSAKRVTPAEQLAEALRECSELCDHLITLYASDMAGDEAAKATADYFSNGGVLTTAVSMQHRFDKALAAFDEGA